MANDMAIVFGDLEIGTAKAIQPKNNDKNLPGYQMKIMPSQRIVERYKLVEGYTMTKEHCVLRWYPKEMVVFYPESNRVFVMVGFNGENTNVSNRHEEIFYILQNMRQTVNNLRGQIAYHSEEMQTMSMQQDIFWDAIIERIKKINSVRGKIDEQQAQYNAINHPDSSGETD